MIKRLFKAFDSVLQPVAGENERKQEHDLQIAAVVLMVEVMRADHEVSDTERDRVLSIAGQRFALDDEETRELMELAHQEADVSVSLHRHTRQLTEGLEMAQRVHLVEHLWEVVFADGIVDRHEEHLVRRIADLLYVPHSQFIKAKHRAAGRL
ncbi:MAG: TerB family tellurite resistance protein [Pseudomonadota bacterium]